jgi:integrase
MPARRCTGSVTKKKRLWYAVLSVGRSDQGKQLRHWSKGFKTRRAAERALAQLLLEERTIAQTRCTVEFVVTQYIEHDITPRGKRSPTTTQRYRGLLKNAHALHNQRVDQLDGATIERAYSALLDHGLSSTTVHHVHNLLFAAFRWAKSKGVALVTRNPFDLDEINRPRRQPSAAQAFTVAQIQAVLQAIEKTKHSNALIFCLATGCRRGEACGLRWSAVDFDRRVAIIRESRYQISGEQGQKPTKARRVREIPLNQTALEALGAERQRQRQWREDAGDAWCDSDHVFCDERGAPLSPIALTNAFRRCAINTGLPTTRLHDLRHTAATFILSAGGSLASTATILGHSEKTTTLRLYGHVIGLDEARAAKYIDRALRKRTAGGAARPPLTVAAPQHLLHKLVKAVDATFFGQFDWG